VKGEWHGSTVSVVLMADSMCKIPPAMNTLVNVGTTKPPAWIDSPPQTPGYVTSVGMAVLYYHPISSWHEAEKIGRRNLAATVSSSVRQLEKQTATEGQAISHSEIRAQLSNVRVLRRWEDPKEGICYVLMRMPMQ
jgi:hypothetical protein